jgi:hypothetical protein
MSGMRSRVVIIALLAAVTGGLYCRKCPNIYYPDSASYIDSAHNLFTGRGFGRGLAA